MPVPMAIPSFGGMTVVLITIFAVPTLYCLVEEARILWRLGGGTQEKIPPRDEGNDDSGGRG